MKLIKFNSIPKNDTQEEVIFINPDYVVAVTPVKDNTEQTELVLNNCIYFLIKEPITNVVHKLTKGK